jgi:hypothetical protein
MELWTTGTHMLKGALGLLTAQFGFSEAVSIIISSDMDRQ